VKRVRYWLPPLLWMGFLFPLWNKLLSSPILYRLNFKFWMWLKGDISPYQIGIYYIYLRRSLHVIAYGLMSFLIYRFFRAEDKRIWKYLWAMYTALITIGYGCMDEMLQSFLKPRNASFMDIVMDAIGTVAVLVMIYICSLRKKDEMASSLHSSQ
jgi:VanZ family protein